VRTASITISAKSCKEIQTVKSVDVAQSPLTSHEHSNLNAIARTAMYQKDTSLNALFIR